MNQNLQSKVLPFQEVDAIVFDLDGTLWDSCEGVKHAWNLGLASWKKSNPCQRGLLSHAEVQGIMGLAFEAIFEKLFPEYDAATQRQLGLYLEEFEAEVLSEQGGVLYPGVADYLPKLSQPLGIVSNCQAGYIEIFLSKAPEFPIVDFKSHGATQLSKSQNILNLCQEQNWQRIVYLGDTTTDYTACQEALSQGLEVQFHLAAWGFAKSQVLELDPDVIQWQSFSEFAQVYQ